VESATVSCDEVMRQQTSTETIVVERTITREIKTTPAEVEVTREIKVEKVRTPSKPTVSIVKRVEVTIQPVLVTVTRYTDKFLGISENLALEERLTLYLLLLCRLLRKTVLLLLALQISGFMAYSLYNLTIIAYNNIILVLPKTHSTVDILGWLRFLLFDVLEIGRFPVLLGNVLVILSGLAFLGEFALDKLKPTNAKDA
jgi:hypothetical protein